MKSFLIFFCTFLAIFVMLGATPAKSVPYNGEVEHLFTHALVAFPELANSKLMKEDYKTDCITPHEFKSVLKSLHKRGYALVDINSIFEEKEGGIFKRAILVPKNKKPLIFSFDDVNYYRKKMGLGMVDKLVLQNDGSIASLSTRNGKEEISYENEFLPILERFIQQNPDFSINGARGTINLTGYDGILGYRTNGNSKTREEEIERVKPLVRRLKELGWTFACHSYGHGHMKRQTLEAFKNDITQWKTEVEPLVGKTDIYVYPYGEWEIMGSKKSELSPKHRVLQDAGFKLFCGVGVKNFYGHLPILGGPNDKPLFMDRKPIDGFSLERRAKEYSHLFNTSEVIETSYRKI